MDVMIYCFKCQLKTVTNNVEQVVTKNHRSMLKGICSICGLKKNKFMSTTTGSGFNLNNFIKNLPIELHQFAEKGENVPEGSSNDQLKYSYCGPGTSLV